VNLTGDRHGSIQLKDGERLAQAPLPAGASVERGVEVGVTGNHRNWRLIGIALARLVRLGFHCE
jgi:hypothetical protein